MKKETRTIEVEVTKWEEGVSRDEFLTVIRTTDGVEYARRYLNDQIALEIYGYEEYIREGESFCYSYDVGSGWVE